MAKLKPGEKRVQLSFQRPEDVRLFRPSRKEAYDADGTWMRSSSPA